MNCIQCRRALDMQTSTSGMIATCLDCGIEHLSLGRLMGLSDSRLLVQIWETIQTSHTKKEWQRSQPCPRCAKDTISIPLRQGNAEHGLIVCPTCYSVAMKVDTLRLFSETNHEFQTKRIAAERILAQKKFQENLQRDIAGAKNLATLGFRTADHLLNETPLREIRGTVLVTIGAIGLSSVTMLLPFASMEFFGSATHSSFMAPLVHLTFFHLAWNLLFFCALSASVEREKDTIPHLVFLFIITSVAIAIGRITSPFPEAPILGLSPLIGALLGRQLTLGIPITFRIPNSKLGLVMEPRNATFLFMIFELRTMIPSSGGMRWFSLTSVLAAWALSAAYTEWQLKKVPRDDAKRESRLVRVVSVNEALSPRNRTSLERKSA